MKYNHLLLNYNVNILIKYVIIYYIEIIYIIFLSNIKNELFNIIYKYNIY